MNETVYFFPTTPPKVISIIDKLKTYNAAVHDGIKFEILKNIRREIAELVTMLIKFCFKSGQFPKLNKIGVVKSTFKSEEKNCMDYYRLITLITTIGKIV